MLYDLHTHTTASDGSLSPAELIARARDKNIACLSITDHDSVAAFHAFENSICGDMRIIPGIEFSTTWEGRGIHILGLNIDPLNTDLLCGVKQQQDARVDRASKIASRLRGTGIANLLEKALHAANGASIGRPHFAQLLVDEGVVKTLQQAYRKYLGNGKPGDVRQFWANLAAVITWIRAAGGTAVLAHPGHYALTNTRLRRLASEFAGLGGQAIEVCNGHQETTLTQKLAALGDEFGLLASCGSDFHGAGNGWSDVGTYSPLPGGCRPVWESW
jgi:predicted metal-dependent phosphoesterase TrpH